MTNRQEIEKIATLKTNEYTSYGDRFLQHLPEMALFQTEKKFTPIMIELAPTEQCNSDCPFCSVGFRPIKNQMPWKKLTKCIDDFVLLGAKSLEITGGGNPLLYKDKEHDKNINDIIRYGGERGLEVAVITNSHKLSRLDPSVYEYIKWIRLSLIMLDEGKTPEEYDWNGFPVERIGFSYIIYETDGVDEASWTKREYRKEAFESIDKIARLVELHPDVKFVRFNPNCLDKTNHTYFRDKYQKYIESVDTHGKMFIKDVSINAELSPRGDGILEDFPLDSSCTMGGFRPYIASNKEGTSHNVYICNSFTLEYRTYNNDYAMCDVADILPTWDRLQKNMIEKGYPYEVAGNKGCGWLGTCKFCFFRPVNILLEKIQTPLDDKNFV